MRVLLLTYFPFYTDHVAGGVQASVTALVDGLRQLGNTFRVLCPPGAAHRLADEAGLEVRPVLREVVASIPDPAGHAANAVAIRDAASDVDVVWSIDRAVLTPLAAPVVVTYSTCALYPDECFTLFHPLWDRLVVPSEFTRRTILPWLAAVAPRASDHVDVLRLPLDASFDTQPDPSWLSRRLGHPAGRHKYVLFPHRPEAAKGHFAALDALAILRTLDASYHLLVPGAPDSLESDRASELAYLDRVADYAAARGLGDHLTIHPWIERADRVHYYAGGSVCLFLSSFPETFGMSLLESVACGTPVVSHGAGALSEVVPPGAYHTVVDRDAAMIAAAVHRLVHCRRSTTETEGYRQHHDRLAVAKELEHLLADARKWHRGSDARSPAAR